MRFLTLLSQMALAALPAAASAQIAEDIERAVQFELLPGWRQVSGSHMAAVRVTLAEGWNTYWRASGGTGIPPRMGFEGSSNFHSARIHWPRPDILDIHGDRVIGYIGELVLPFEVTPKSKGGDVGVQVVLDLGVCSDMCLPVQVSFSEVLSVGQFDQSLDITRALATVPRGPEETGLRSISCDARPIKGGFHITAQMDLPQKADGTEITMFEFDNPDVWINPPVTNRIGDMLVAEADLADYGGGLTDFDPGDLRVTVLGPEVSIDIPGCPGN